MPMILAVPAQAAETVRAPSIVGLRACGEGGVILPGSDTCLRISGALAAEASLRAGGASPVAAERRGLTRLGTAARVSLDARTPTGMGPVRLYLSLRNRTPGDSLGR